MKIDSVLKLVQPLVNLLEFRTLCATKLCLFSIHHQQIIPFSSSYFNHIRGPCLASHTPLYHPQHSGPFRSFSLGQLYKLHKHISTFWLRSVYSIFKLTARTPIDQSDRKVWANNSLATSLSTWQTEDYYFNGKFYLKTLNPTMEALALYFK